MQTAFPSSGYWCFRVKKALIVGCNGQDGRLLTEYLAEKKYSVTGIDSEIYLQDKVSYDRKIDISCTSDINELVREIQPDEIYYFAAYHHSSEQNTSDDAKLFSESYRINVFSLVNFLDAVKKYSGKTKLFYASSSLIFGENEDELVDETSKCNPDSVYGITKFDGLQICRYYRNTYGVFASVGIMFNHESIYRQDKFLSRKIINSAVRINNGSSEKLSIGDLSSETDWGYAPDYVDAAWRILNLDKPDDFIIASGKKHTVGYFAETAFKYFGLDWKDHIEENKSALFRRRKPITGNPGKLKLRTGWSPKVSFEKMIEIIADYESADFKNKAGKIFENFI